jgi:hypothetical protein
MAITFLVDSVHRVVRATYTGAVTLPDLTEYSRTLLALQVLALPQLIDARGATLLLSEGDLEDFSALMGSLRRVFGHAPVAFVAGNHLSYLTAEHYEDLSAGYNPAFRVFEDVATAETWIVGHATGHDPGP